MPSSEFTCPNPPEPEHKIEPADQYDDVVDTPGASLYDPATGDVKSGQLPTLSLWTESTLGSSARKEYQAPHPPHLGIWLVAVVTTFEMSVTRNSSYYMKGVSKL